MKRNTSQLSLANIFETILKIGDPDIPVSVIVDGLDELPPDDISFLLKHTLKVADDSSMRKSILVSSRRNVREIERRRTKDTGWIMELKGCNDNDIELYIKSELEEIINDHSLATRDPSLAKNLVDTLINKADGLFTKPHS